MLASKKAYELIAKWEGFSSTPYLCPANIATVGYGSTYYPDGRKVQLSDKPITEAKAMDILCQNTEYKVKGINRYLNIQLKQHQFDAIVSFVYNVGLEAFRTSTMLRKINMGDVKGAGAEFDRWVYSNGKKLRGLVNRRRDERAMFEGKL